MERFLPIVLLVGWFATLFASSYLINWLLVRSVIRRYYRFFIAPGVIVHELSHAAGCLLTGSEIVEIKFWETSGGHVKHLQTHNPLMRMVSDPLIGLAPIWGTFLVLALLTWFLAPDLIVAIVRERPSLIVEAFDFTSWQTWLYLYLTTSLVATIAPSKTDLNYALASLVVMSLLLVCLLFVPGIDRFLLSYQAELKVFAYFTLGILTIAVVIAFLLAIPMRNRNLNPRLQID